MSVHRYQNLDHAGMCKKYNFQYKNMFIQLFKTENEILSAESDSFKFYAKKKRVTFEGVVS